MSVSPVTGSVLGLIPAKGGSTRLTRKNVRKLGDKSLLAWAAEAAQRCGVIDRLIVSTEDREVASVAKELGLEMPFVRPRHLARDPAGVVDVALHALEELETHGESYRHLIILLPTCPFRTADDVRAAYRLFVQRDGKFLMSVSPFSHTPFTAMALNEDGLLEPYFPEYIGRKSQEMPEAYRPNGAIHVLDVEAFRHERTYFGRPLISYVMPIERSVDIDTMEDLQIAEARLVLARNGGH